MINCAAGRVVTKDGFEGHMGTNYLGPFLLTMLLLPCMQHTAETVREYLAAANHHPGRLKHCMIMLNGVAQYRTCTYYLDGYPAL